MCDTDDGRISRGEFQRYQDSRWAPDDAEAEAGGSKGKGLKIEVAHGVEVPHDQATPSGEFALGALADGFFAEADTDGDGFVSKEEFVAWHVRMTGVAPGREEWQLFYDADGNGDRRRLPVCSAAGADAFRAPASSAWAELAFVRRRGWTDQSRGVPAVPGLAVGAG